MESLKNPKGNPNRVHRRNRTRNSKKDKNFDKNLLIASRGINKFISKEKACNKTKENLECLLEEETLEEILKATQVDATQILVTNHHNVNLHGQKSNFEQLGPTGIRAQGSK